MYTIATFFSHPLKETQNHAPSPTKGESNQLSYSYEQMGKFSIFDEIHYLGY